MRAGEIQPTGRKSLRQREKKIERETYGKGKRQRKRGRENEETKRRMETEEKKQNMMRNERQSDI